MSVYTVKIASSIEEYVALLEAGFTYVRITGRLRF
jgi:hypothetical protein